MSKHTSSVLLPAILVLALACGKAEEVVPPPPPPPPIDKVLPNVPVPPEGTPLATESGADVTQLIFVTPIKPDSIVKYYETKLAENGFRLVSQQKVKDQTIFMAEQDGPSLWVTVEPSGEGSSVRIAGGADLSKSKPDSGAVKKP